MNTVNKHKRTIFQRGAAVKQTKQTETNKTTSLKLLWDNLINAPNEPLPSHAHLVTISAALLALPQHLRANIWPSGIKQGVLTPLIKIYIKKQKTSIWLTR